MKKYIFYSTIFSIFTEALWINIGFDLKFFYLIVISNLFIFMLLKKVSYNNGLLIFNLILLFSGFFSCILGYNKFGYFFVQFFFLLIIPIYYNSYFRFFDSKFYEIVSIYCKICFILAIIGLLKLPHDISIGRSLDSLLQEPAHYCTIVLPAYYITLRDKSYPRYYFIIILLSILLSGSSLGYIALGLSMIFLLKKISLTKSILPLVFVFIIGNVVYNNFEPFKLRFDDTTNSLISGDLSKANLSTYALLSNLYVAVKSFSSNPILGNGIGSHIHSRDLYLNKIEGIEIFESMGMENLNAQDGGSLFIRVMSELGLVGIFGIFIFIFKFYVKNKEKDFGINSIISRGILLYFFVSYLGKGIISHPKCIFLSFCTFSINMKTLNLLI